MSLARTALRLAAVEALKVDPVIAALCAGRIYDSRIGDFSHREPVPVIILRTEDDQGGAFSRQNGGAPFDRTCDLTIEVAMQALAVDQDGAVLGIGTPATDRELEAVLDLIEERAVEVLTVGDSAMARLVRQVTRRVTRVGSTRFATDDTGERLAIRLVSLAAELKGEDRDITVAPAGPFAKLPDPLRTVCAALPAGSSGAVVCQMIVDALPAETLTPFAGADLTLQPVPSLSPAGPPKPPTDPAGTPAIVDKTMSITWS